MVHFALGAIILRNYMKLTKSQWRSRVSVLLRLGSLSVWYGFWSLPWLHSSDMYDIQQGKRYPSFIRLHIQIKGMDEKPDHSYHHWWERNNFVQRINSKMSAVDGILTEYEKD